MPPIREDRSGIFDSQVICREPQREFGSKECPEKVGNRPQMFRFTKPKSSFKKNSSLPLSCLGPRPKVNETLRLFPDTFHIFVAETIEY